MFYSVFNHLVVLLSWSCLINSFAPFAQGTWTSGRAMSPVSSTRQSTNHWLFTTISTFTTYACPYPPPGLLSPRVPPARQKIILPIQKPTLAQQMGAPQRPRRRKEVFLMLITAHLPGTSVTTHARVLNPICFVTKKTARFYTRCLIWNIPVSAKNIVSFFYLKYVCMS